MARSGETKYRALDNIVSYLAATRTVDLPNSRIARFLRAYVE